jgi:hypothetical protein
VNSSRVREAVRLTILVGIVVLGACAHGRPAAVMDRDIDAAAIATLLPNDIGLPAIISEEAIPFPRRDESTGFGGTDALEFERPPAWLWKDAPPTLRRALARQPPIERTLFTVAVFRSNARVVPTAEIRTALSSSGVVGNWHHFARHSRATSWQAFSKVLVTHDSRDAVVYW